MFDTVQRWFRSDPTASEQPREEPPMEHAPVSEEVEFAAYAEDCRIFGFMRLEAERLSDALNERSEYQLQSVLLVGLEDGRTAEARDLVVSRDELFAVRASGRRGNQLRRGRTRPSPVTLKAGPYLVHGYVHAPPGADPIQHIRRRRAMVPLTGAWIEYIASGEQHRARVGTIIVNRELIDWVDLSRDEDMRVDLPVETSIDPRAKDMTGYVWARADEPAVDDVAVEAAADR